MWQHSVDLRKNSLTDVEGGVAYKEYVVHNKRPAESRRFTSFALTGKPLSC